MNLEEYFDRYGVNLDELALAAIRRAEMLDPVRVEELLRRLRPEGPSGGRSASQDNLLNLMEEARENLELARRLRNSVTGQGGELLGTVSEVSKVIMAADKAVDACSKRWSVVYNITTMQTLEDTVRDVMSEMDEDTSERFLAMLEDRLKGIR